MAQMPIFPLACWELPPDCDEPLEASATSVHVSAQGVEFWIRQVKTPRGNRVFFREANSTEVGNWVSPDRVDWFNRFGIDADFDRYRFTNFARYFCFEGQHFGHPGLMELLIAPRYGLWLWGPNPTTFIHSPYDWPEFYLLRAAQIGHIAKGWLYNSQWPARFTLNWMHASHLERQSLIFSVLPENLQHVQNLLFYVLRTEKWKLDATPSTISWRVKEQPSDSWHEDYADCHALLDGATVYTSARLTRWKNALWAYFDLSVERGSEGLIRQEISDFRPYDTLRIDTSFPTAHEIIESHLALHEWVQSIGSPPHFQQLLALDKE